VLQVNPELEQALVELAVGRMSGRLNYNLEAIGKKPTVTDVLVAKNVLAHYMRAEQMHQKIKEFRYTA